jgi:hypothetical protein
MRRFLWIMGALLSFQTALADESPPPLLTTYLDRTEQLTVRAKERVAELAEENRRALERLENESIRSSDAALRLWTARELRLHKEFPFCNLYRPDGLNGYPKDLQTLSADLRTGLTAFLARLNDEKGKLIKEAERAFDVRVRSLVRANEIDDAQQERDAFNGYSTHRVMKDLDLEIERVERLLSGKPFHRLWSRPKDDNTPAPPDARFLFEPDNPAFTLFLKNVTAVSNGSPDRGDSGAGVGTRIRIQGRRGLAVLALAGNEVILRGHYDTYESREEALRLVEDIQGLPYGAFVVVVSHDDATRRFAGEAQSTLFRLGATQGIADLPYRSAYLLIGIKGMRPGGAVERVNNLSVKHPSSFDSER